MALWLAGGLMAKNGKPNVDHTSAHRPFFLQISYIAGLTTFSHGLAVLFAFLTIGFSAPWTVLLGFNFILLCTCSWLGHRAGVDRAESIASEGIAQLIATIGQVGTQATIVGLLIMP